MKLLYLDIETKPNIVHTWGLFNQFVSINQIVEPGGTICYAYKWDGDKKIHFSMHKDKGFHKNLWKVLNEADAICHFNGKKFDIPILMKELLLKGYPPPSPSHQIDLYRVVRSEFKFSSNKLDFVAQQLGIGAKEQHKGHELWVGCMAGDEKAWRKMRSYNIQDVRLLPRLYKRLQPWIRLHPNVALYTGDDRMQCPNCGGHHMQARGYSYTRLNKYKRFVCKDCGKWSRARLAEKMDKSGLMNGNA